MASRGVSLVSLVFAGCKEDDAYVYRQNFDNRKWENIAGQKTSRVHFLRQGDEYLIRITPGDGSGRKEYPLAKEDPIQNSGDGFLQVPLPGRQELYGIKFKNPGTGEQFFAKVVNELGPRGSVLLPQGGVVYHRPGSGPMTDLPAPIPVPFRPELCPPNQQQQHHQQFQPPSETMVMGPQPVLQQQYLPFSVGGGRGNYPIPQQGHLYDQPDVGFGQQAGYPQPAYPQQRNQPPLRHEQAMGRQPPQRPLETATPKARPMTPPTQHRNVQPLPPNPPPSQDISSMANFLMKAINNGNHKAAKGMIDILATLHPDKRNFTVSYDKVPEKKEEHKKFMLETDIEFQAPHKRPLTIFVEVDELFTIQELQYLVELEFHIPKATQNWIIGPRLVKQADLKRTLQEYGITAAGADASKAKVYLYVMHAKKANVPKEEYDMIRERQRQQQINQQQVLQGPPTPGTPGTPEFVDSPYRTPEIGPGGSDTYDHLRRYQGYPQQQQAMAQQPGNYTPQYPPQRVYVPEDPMYDQLRFRPDDITRSAAPRAAIDITGREEDGNFQLGPPQAKLQQQAFVGGYPAQVVGEQPVGIPITAAPPPPPPKEEKKIGWVCVACTFINRPRRPGCEVCSTERPADYQIPDDCPPDEEDVKLLEEAEMNERLLQELQEQEKLREVQQREVNYRELLEAEEEDIITNTDEFDCPICFVPIEEGDGVRLRNCLHQFCKECLHMHITNCADAEVKCAFQDDEYACDAPMTEREIRGLVTPEELNALYRRGLQQAEGAAANSFHCRTPNCEGFCFYEDEVNEFKCPVCTKENCLLCKAIHENMNCQEYQDDLKRLAANDEAAKATQDMLEELVRKGDAMNCPSCKVIVQKKYGCDWVMCSMCKTEMCWATKGPRWGPKGPGDISGGCRCGVGGKMCHPRCGNCH